MLHNSDIGLWSLSWQLAVGISLSMPLILPAFFVSSLLHCPFSLLSHWRSVFASYGNSQLRVGYV
ncbi:hypothetical protein BDF20DRAFT_869679 [Mycotypha africana]|uniref:uncharacterized protein n=1 Tax=Mycotypha africana TaxID=64632 RepID=UPI00230124CD|nr:uncharacterized protein BDF20DRAFT_869679 [Mycotypha africana]KAI8979462.1 hypothetical protein BDF20DRAFT_869679 [Mycotypha africana]